MARGSREYLLRIMLGRWHNSHIWSYRTSAVAATAAATAAAVTNMR